MEANKLVVINPDTELKFEPIKNDPTGQLKATLLIQNVSANSNLAYKVKTTAPRHYVVKPNQGILDFGKSIAIDITLINTPDNKIDENKFLVQVAPCNLSQSENYALQKFWEALEKKLSINYKLRVSIPSTGSAPPANSSPVQQPQSFPAQVESPQTSPPVRTEPIPQPNLSSQPKRQEYEKAPDDNINQTYSQPAPQQPEYIKTKVDELKREFEAVQRDKERLRAQISELQKGGQSEKELHAWQSDDKEVKGFSLLHLLIAGIISLYFGYQMTRQSALPAAL